MSVHEREGTKTCPGWRGSRLDFAAAVSALIDVIRRETKNDVLCEVLLLPRDRSVLTVEQFLSSLSEAEWIALPSIEVRLHAEAREEPLRVSLRMRRSTDRDSEGAVELSIRGSSQGGLGSIGADVAQVIDRSSRRTRRALPWVVQTVVAAAAAVVLAIGLLAVGAAFFGVSQDQLEDVAMGVLAIAAFVVAVVWTRLVPVVGPSRRGVEFLRDDGSSP